MADNLGVHMLETARTWEFLGFRPMASQPAAPVHSSESVFMEQKVPINNRTSTCLICVCLFFIVVTVLVMFVGIFHINCPLYLREWFWDTIAFLENLDILIYSFPYVFCLMLLVLLCMIVVILEKTSNSKFLQVCPLQNSGVKDSLLHKSMRNGVMNITLLPQHYVSLNNIQQFILIIVIIITLP